MFLGWDSSAAVLLFRLQINMRAAVRVTLLKGALLLPAMRKVIKYFKTYILE